MPTSSGPRTLLKGMHVLSLLKAAAPAGLGATEVAVQTGLDRVNVQRLFLALEASGGSRATRPASAFMPATTPTACRPGCGRRPA